MIAANRGGPDNPVHRWPGAFWLGAGLIVLAQLLLAWVALRALSQQAGEEEARQRREAATRLHRAALTFAGEVAGRWHKAQGLVFPSRREVLPVLGLADRTVADPQTFLDLSVASGASRRGILLQALIDAPDSHKPFWNLLLARQAFRDGDPEAGRRALDRVLETPGDFRLAHGWSIKAEAARCGLVESLSRGNQADGVAWLCRLSALAAPVSSAPPSPSLPLPDGGTLPVQLDTTPASGQSLLRSVEIFRGDSWGRGQPSPELPAASVAGLGRWQRLVPFLWSEMGPMPHQPRWISAAGEPALLLPRGEGAVLIPAGEEWAALERMLLEAVGSRFVIRLVHGNRGEPLPGMEGASVVWLNGSLSPVETLGGPLPARPETLATGSRWGGGPETLATGSRWGGGPETLATGSRWGGVWPGLLATLGLLGVALLIQTFWRRDQESRYWGAQERFYRQAAHDLKTPLATLRALAETLSLGRVAEPGQADRYYRTMIREADQAAGVVDGMLLAARLESGLVQPTPETVLPAEVVRSLLDRLAPRLEGWTVEVTIPADAAVRVDPAMFSRALLNLLENVLRHAADGRRLIVSARPIPPSLVEIRVGDGGSGRVEGDRFSPPAGGPGSSGLGLELTRTITERHGGELHLENRAGGGIWAITSWPEEKDHGNHPDR